MPEEVEIGQMAECRRRSKQNSRKRAANRSTASGAMSRVGY